MTTNWNGYFKRAIEYVRHALAIMNFYEQFSKLEKTI